MNFNTKNKNASTYPKRQMSYKY